MLQPVTHESLHSYGCRYGNGPSNQHHHGRENDHKTLSIEKGDRLCVVTVNLPVRCLLRIRESRFFSQVVNFQIHGLHIRWRCFCWCKHTNKYYFNVAWYTILSRLEVEWHEFFFLLGFLYCRRRSRSDRLIRPRSWITTGMDILQHFIHGGGQHVACDTSHNGI